MPPETDAEVIDLASRRAAAPPQEDDDLDDEYEVRFPAGTPAPPRQAVRSTKRTQARRAAGYSTFPEIRDEIRETKAAYEAAAEAYQTALIRREAERFDAATTPDELAHQIAYLSSGRFDVRSFVQDQGYLTARQAAVVLRMADQWGLIVLPEAVPPIHRVATQAPELAQADLDRLSPYLSAQAKAALRRSR